MAKSKFLVLCTILAAGCLPAAQAPVAEAPPKGGDLSQYVLGPDDTIKVWVLGLEEVSPNPVRITPAGDVDLPGAGQVHAAGLTMDQFKARLVQAFKKQLLHPEVSVEIVDFGSQPVSVIGALSKPGVYQLRGRKTLAEIISLAEGLRPDAGPWILIQRPIESGPIPLAAAKPDASGKFNVAQVRIKELIAGEDPADNVQVLAHDLISVPPAQVVYVMGDVKKAGEVSLKDRDTISVLQALASAEGMGPAPAALKDTKIMRLKPNSTTVREEIPIDLKKVQEGKAEDIAMRPNDILFVPPSGPKKAAARLAEAAVQAVTGVAIWGTRF
jgi:polysaccharide export outer membrane protein